MGDLREREGRVHAGGGGCHALGGGAEETAVERLVQVLRGCEGRAGAGCEEAACALGLQVACVSIRTRLDY